MRERGTLLPALERLFEGPRNTRLTLDAFLAGLEGSSYAFIIAALDLPNCVPTGIPLLSTITGLPMLLFMAQALLGRPTPSLPAFLGMRSLPRGKLQDFLARTRPSIERIEDAVHPRHGWWVTGARRHLLRLALGLMAVVLAAPIPLDNLLPAWSILFFCLALIEGDGVMAMLGWLFALLSIVWTAFLLVVGPMVVVGVIKSVI
ncbi:MAG: exopolysaccharide biosynthesis protein [Proteobacteria bacterium]|nr:exopolysaccharide biosynthesis protein [Pseudomonadota bacterium]